MDVYVYFFFNFVENLFSKSTNLINEIKLFYSIQASILTCTLVSGDFVQNKSTQDSALI